MIAVINGVTNVILGRGDHAIALLKNATGIAFVKSQMGIPNLPAVDVMLSSPPPSPELQILFENMESLNALIEMLVRLKDKMNKSEIKKG